MGAGLWMLCALSVAAWFVAVCGLGVVIRDCSKTSQSLYGCASSEGLACFELVVSFFVAAFAIHTAVTQGRNESRKRIGASLATLSTALSAAIAHNMRDSAAACGGFALVSATSILVMLNLSGSETHKEEPLLAFPQQSESYDLSTYKVANSI